MNRVQVDPAQVAGMFDDVRMRWRHGKASSDKQKWRMLDEQAEVERDKFGSMAQMVVATIDAKVCPNWGLADDEKAKLEQYASECIALWAPESIPDFEQWHPMYKLGFTVGVIAIARVDRDVAPFPNMPYIPGLKPLHEPKDDEQRKQPSADGQSA